MQGQRLYVCDGRKPCRDGGRCRWNGGSECSHTRDVSHARYGEPRAFVLKHGIYIEKVGEDGEEKARM